MKTLLTLLIVITLSNISFSQTTAIPDTNFEQALINLGYDSGVPDGLVPTANINTVLGLTIVFQNISDLTGIEDFTALRSLTCYGNQLTSLDLSQNLDLRFLWCYNNQLTNLNITQNTLLTNLKCNSNQLTNLDLTQNPALTELDCSYNLLTTLDLSQNVALPKIICNNNLLQSLDVSNNIQITQLKCQFNLLISLDISRNQSLTTLTCNNNQLTCLNVKNGLSISYYNLDARNNPDLHCIEVNTSTTSYYYVDAGTTFSTNCNNSCSNHLTYIPDDGFESRLQLLGLDTGTLDNFVPTSNIDTLTYLNFGGGQIWDLTGINDFTSLVTLICTNGQFSSLDLSYNPNLTYLKSTDNHHLTNINVTQNTALTYFNCSGNWYVSNIDISHNTLLTTLICNSMSLSNLNVTQNTALSVLNCYNNNLSNIDITHNPVLLNLNCGSNNITSLNLSQNTLLTSLYCEFSPELESLNVSNNPNITILELAGFNPSKLTCLNVKNGNNLNFTNFRTNGNVNLYCIEVDDANWSTLNWTTYPFFFDSQTSFSNLCPNTCIIGISKNNFSNLSLYPNPTTGNITIDLGITKNDVKTTVTNNLGQIILTKNYTSINYINLDLDYPKGIYFLTLETKGEVVTKKLIKN